MVAVFLSLTLLILILSHFNIISGEIVGIVACASLLGLLELTLVFIALKKELKIANDERKIS